MTQPFQNKKLKRKTKKKEQKKKLSSPWITRGLKKSSERKKHLYEKFLKRRNDKKRESI